MLIGGTASATLAGFWLVVSLNVMLSWDVVLLNEEAIVLKAKLHDTEMMLLRCFDGGAAAYVDETLPSGQVVREYQECPKKVERRIYP